MTPPDLRASPPPVVTEGGARAAQNLSRLPESFTTTDDSAQENEPEMLSEFGVTVPNLRAISNDDCDIPGLELPGHDAIGGDEHGTDAASLNHEDFYAHLPSGQFIYRPTREFWPAASVNAALPKRDKMRASDWLSCHRPVHQVAWVPGEGELVINRLTDNGGWTPHHGANCYNIYQPALDLGGYDGAAGPWVDLVRRVYPDEAEHLLNWFAHRVQRPGDKCNHAIVMGGGQGIGKDTMLDPVKSAVGPWNFADIGPSAAMGRFNGFLKSTVLRVSEARDLGEHDRFAFYDKSKTWIAAPPDVHRIDEKNRQEYAAFNVCGVIITTNRMDAIHLEADDRRHFVAWSDLSKDDFSAEDWSGFWNWLERGGRGHVQAYLRARDLHLFNAKAPPPKTAAFRAILAAGCAPETSEATDAFEALGWPDAVTIARVQGAASISFEAWLKEPRNRRTIPHRFEECGYVRHLNPGTTDGRYKISGVNTAVYVKRVLTERQRHDAVAGLIEGQRP